MSSERWSTHTVELKSDVVVKRFRDNGRERGAREWRALTLLARYAPGLAPAPVSADLTDARPSVKMSRLTGVPMRGLPLDDERIAALARAVGELHAAVPQPVLADLPPRPWQQVQVIAAIRSWTPGALAETGRTVRSALKAGLDWLDRSGMERASRQAVPAVFGPGDGNLANYLWDGLGRRVRVVDFEDSGRSDRAFELAEITEHVASWVGSSEPGTVGESLDIASFLGHFDLTAAEADRLTDCRRLLALVWLFLLRLDDPVAPRNPPGTAERQAERLMALLG